MEYRIIQDNVFSYKDCYYAHCISRDYALGAGIAVEFSELLPLNLKVLKELRNYSLE